MNRICVTGLRKASFKIKTKQNKKTTQTQQLYLLCLLIQVNAIFVHELTQSLWVSKVFGNLFQRQ